MSHPSPLASPPSQPHSALVTGGGHGLGEAVSRALHAAGFRVAIGDLDLTAAQAVAADLDPTGKTAHGLAFDAREQASFEQALVLMTDLWGGAQVLVNNAAMTVARPVLDIPPEEFDAVMAVNLRGTFLGCQVFGRSFRDKGYGRIVNMASLAGQNGGTATGAHYAISKGGIITLTKVFARDLASHGVTVNAIAPGPLDLPSVRRTVPEDKLPGLIQNIPAGSLGDPTFVAHMVAQLAGPDAGFVTGATWDINGGLFMR
ncbi:SDR family NAD(P)-dependent oxidoreductase [Rhodospirillum sp. A1_3_36]|uniref:SDR family NAD(P)-dependent oxidoreductase n=1 Tax=Rhodospirillum sp. A1_3_36 TaxID=3391666 RepID=UPI0039A658AD